MRETELVNAGEPLHDIAARLENSEPVESGTVCRTRNECRFRGTLRLGVRTSEAGSEAKAKLHQAAFSGAERLELTEALGDERFLPECAEPCGSTLKSKVTRPGLEPGMAGPKPAVLPFTPPGTKTVAPSEESDFLHVPQHE